MEGAFKIVLGISVLLACLAVVGIFILILKILLLFSTEIHILGLVVVAG